MKYPKNLHVMVLGVAVIIIVSGIAVFSSQFQQPSSETAVKKIQEAYAALGTSVEVLSAKEESGIYRVLLRAANTTTLQEIYVTKDGSLLLGDVERLDAYTSRILREDNFSQCLLSRGIVVFGSNTDVNTLQQLQALGSFSGRVFFDCSRSLQTCINLNITSVPATAHENQVYYGIQPVSLYTQLTGCTL